MKYNIIEEKDKIIIKNVDHFELKHTLIGQCFRWNEEDDGSYTGVAYNRVINVKKDGDNIVFSNTNINDFNEIWYDYFDLNKDYGEIKNVLSADSIMKEAIKFGHGIRILKQDVWEILISFIISANNRIPMIQRAIETLSQRYGEYIGEYRKKKYYGFPTADRLKLLTLEEIKACSTGFRAKYIMNTTAMVADNNINIYMLKNLPIEDARKELMKFPGVGPKVADCIMLFSMNKQKAFPIDVWIKRVMEHFYLTEDTKLKEIQKYAQRKFGDNAGIAQQYLFYYARELGIGK